MTIITTLILITIGAELIVRTVDSLSGRGFCSPHRNPLARPPRPLHPFRLFGPWRYRTVAREQQICASDGVLFPFKKAPDTCRIVLFGGSTIFNRITREGSLSETLRHALTERVPERQIEVINTGYPAYSSAQSLVSLALDVLSWDPDILVIQNNANDLITSYWPDFTCDYAHMYSHPCFIPDYRTRSLQYVSTTDILLRHLQVYWIAKWMLKTFFVRKKQQAPLRRASLGHEPNLFASQIFERNLRSFVTLAQAHSIRVLLMTQALDARQSTFERHTLAMPYNDRVVYPLHEEYIRHHHAYNRIIEKVAQDTNEWFIDTYALFGDEDGCFHDFGHYSRSGIEKMATGIAEYLGDRIASSG